MPTVVPVKVGGSTVVCQNMCVTMSHGGPQQGPRASSAGGSAVRRLDLCMMINHGAGRQRSACNALPVVV